MAPRQRPRKRRPSTSPPPNQSISISFIPEELQFLVEGLRDLPIKGTADSLSRILPLIQGVRLKLASALQVASAPPEKPTLLQQPPEEAPATE